MPSLLPPLHRNRWTAIRPWVAGSAALTLGASSLGAQYASELVPYTLGVGVGWARPQGTFADKMATGYQVDFALGIEPHRVPVGARFDAMYAGFIALGNYIPTVPTTKSGVGGIWGGLADVTVGHPSGRGIHPYALGGLGIYGRSVELWRNPTNTAVINDPALGFVNVIPKAQATRITDTENAGGWNAGAGIAFGIYPADLFIEVRYHQIETAVKRTEIIPVTIGFRF